MLTQVDKKHRDAAIETLKKWIIGSPTLSDLDLMKLWKGLFYCMWMSDKPHIQHRLATDLAQLSMLYPSALDGLRFVNAFWRTMCREWHGVDYLRMDKFYFLLRQVMQESWRLLASVEFDRECVELFSEIVSQGPLSSDEKSCPRSIRFHVCENYLSSLVSVGERVDGAMLTMLLKPVFELLAVGKDKVVFDKLKANFFQGLVDQFQLPDDGEVKVLEIDIQSIASAAWSVGKESENQFRIRQCVELLAQVCPSVMDLFKVDEPAESVVVTTLMNGMKKRRRVTPVIEKAVDEVAQIKTNRTVSVEQIDDVQVVEEVDEVSVKTIDKNGVTWAKRNRVLRFNKRLPASSVKPSSLKTSTSVEKTSSVELKSKLKKARTA